MKKDSHFESTLRSALFVNIVAKQIAPENVSGSHRDHFNGDEERREAEAGIDQNRVAELWLDLVMGQHQVKVWD